jgi:hypothetical protein
MKISDILKGEGVFSNEIKSRFSNGQIRLNGEVVKSDIDLGNIEIIEAGEWIFNLITPLSKEKKNILFFIIDLFSVETLFSGDCQINDKPIENILPELNIIKKCKFLKASKKQMFIIKTSNQ